MDKGVFLASNGANQLLKAMQVATNNLANANTIGFKEDMIKAKSIVVEGGVHEMRVYNVVSGTDSDMRAGSTITTGNSLDIAINGKGWIAVQTNAGKEAYTRAGDLHMSNDGLLTTSRGDLVMGNGGPITIPPAQKVEIGVDGTISILPLGEQGQGMVELDRIKLAIPEEGQLAKADDGLFYAQNGPLEADNSVRVIPGSLEGSNVNAIGALVEMIELSRTYEAQVKMMENLAENADKSAQILQVR